MNKPANHTYPSKLLLERTHRNVTGDIHLDGSKSISNRALIIRALSGKEFTISGLGTARDVTTMQALLSSGEDVLDAGAAGTTFRFLTAYLAWSGKRCILTGSDRMKQRPIGALVSALRALGAHIDYLEQEGYPPLRFHGDRWQQTTRQLSLPANISSQYLSALLMIAPCLPQGLELHLEGDLVSRPYLEMTLRMMAYFGVQHQWSGQTISVDPQTYQPKPFQVEADWSAASYYYSIAALSNDCQLRLYGLHENSLQGDSALAGFMTKLGVITTFLDDHLLLVKSRNPLPSAFTYNFIACPDLAQTVIACCAGLGKKGVFQGLQTLFIKETDRIRAMSAELKKVGVDFAGMPASPGIENDFQQFVVTGKAQFNGIPSFATYEDHRMAMALAPLAMIHPIEIEDPGVVVKSYPDFWKDLEQLDFHVIRRED